MAKPNKNTTKVETPTKVENTVNTENNSTETSTINTIITSENTNADALTYSDTTGTVSYNDTVSVVDDLNQNQLPDEEPKISSSDINVNSLLKTIADLTKKVDELTKKTEDTQKSEEKSSDTVTQQPYQAPQTVVPVPVPVNNTSNAPSEMSQILNHLINKKSDKEVTIVHNQERIGGLSTAIRLTGVSIDFHKKGEVATLSWQQFEECVSRYRSWFDKKIVLLSYEDRELADRYHVPFLGQDGLLVLTRDQLLNSGKLTGNQLEDLYNKLCPEDQENLCTHWIGKCYEKAPGFYDMYKVEILNRLSRKGAFDNILVSMRNDSVRNSISANRPTNTGASQMGVVVDVNVSQPQMGVVTDMNAPQMGIVY